MNDEIRNFKVNDKESFIELVNLLREDLQANKWENNTLENYLEALSRYAEDIQGYYDNTKQNINADIPSWKVFSDILIGASMYE